MNKQSLVGLLCVICGLMPLSVSFGLLVSTSSAPDWVLSLIGVLFVVCGLVVMTGQKLHTGSLVAAFILLTFSLLGFWIAFLSQPPPPLIVQIFIGLGSLVTLLLSVYAIRENNRTGGKEEK